MPKKEPKLTDFIIKFVGNERSYQDKARMSFWLIFVQRIVEKDRADKKICFENCDSFWKKCIMSTETFKTYTPQ